MTDINRQSGTRRRATAQRPGAEPDGSPPVQAGATTLPAGAVAAHGPPMAYVELLFFAYRDFTSDPDSILTPLGFGRAHHRVVHFVHHYPGLRVADLLVILKITKQSLGRVLRELVTGGYVEQRRGPSDGRERRLYATEAGARLARRLAGPQLERIAQALTAAVAAANETGSPPTDAREVARIFLYHMITPAERVAVDALMAHRLEN